MWFVAVAARHFAVLLKLQVSVRSLDPPHDITSESLRLIFIYFYLPAAIYGNLALC